VAGSSESSAFGMYCNNYYVDCDSDIHNKNKILMINMKSFLHFVVGIGLCTRICTPLW